MSTVLMDSPRRAAGSRALGNRFLSHVMQAVLRRPVPLTAPDPWTTDIYYEEVRLHGLDDPRNGPYVMPLVTLRTNPCRWSTSAGCVMCGYHLGANRQQVTDQMLVAQTRDAITRLDPGTYPALVFTSNGSFFDRAEVSEAIRPVLVGMLRDAGFRYLIMESRPEYLATDKLREVAAAFAPEGRHRQTGRYPLSVSFGLESSDDFIQQYCINKGRRRSDYETAFEHLRAEGYSYDCYVLLGKPFLSAREDVADAIRTIRFAVDRGAEYVFVMVTNMVDYSLTSYLQERGRYALPSLWRAVELLERLPERYRRAVQIKGISHAPVPPSFYARTCELCNEHVKGALNFWNQTGQWEHVRSIHRCACRDRFKKDEWDVRPHSSLTERVLREYQLLADELDVDAGLIPTRTDLGLRQWRPVSE